MDPAWCEGGNCGLVETTCGGASTNHGKAEPALDRNRMLEMVSVLTDPVMELEGCGVRPGDWSRW